MYQPQTKSAASAELVRVRAFAKKHLERAGIVSISNEADCFVIQGQEMFAGTGKDKDGRLRKFRLEYDSATFGKSTTWEAKRLTIDGELKYRVPP